MSRAKSLNLNGWTEMTETVHRLLKFDLICRCAILATSMTTAGLANFVPTSLTSKLIASSGHYGIITLILFSSAVLLGLLDAIINDLMPDVFSFVWLKRHRHLIYFSLSGLYFAQGFVAVGGSLDIEDVLAASYAASGIVITWYAFAISVRANHV